MADMLDEVMEGFSPAQIITKEGPDVHAARNKVRNAIVESQPVLDANDKALMAVISETTQKMGSSYKTIDYALTRQRDMSQNPAIFNEIVGLFDSDFNQDYQEKQVSVGLNQLNMQNQNLNSAVQTHQAVEGMLNRQIATEEALYGLEKADIADIAAIEDWAYSAELKQNEKLLEFMRGQTDKQLSAWANDPSKAPMELSSKPYLIQEEMLARRSKKLAVANQGVELGIKQFSLKALQKQETLAGLTDEQVLEIVNNQNTTSGVPRQEALDELQRREMQVMTVQSNRNALMVQDAQTADFFEQKFIEASNSTELTKLAQQAAQNGGVVKVGEMELSVQQLQAAAAEAATNEKKAALTQWENSTLAIEQAGKTQENLTASGLIQTEPTSPAFDARVQVYTAKLKELEDRAKNGLIDPAIVAEVVKIENEAMATAITAEQTRLVESRPEAERGAVKEFITTGTVSAQNANTYAAHQTNPYVLGGHPIYDYAYQEFSKTLQRLSTEDTNKVTSFKIGGENAVEVGGVQAEADMQFSAIQQGKAPDEQIVREALEESRALENVTGIIVQDIFKAALTDLATQEEAAGGANYWRAIYDPGTDQFAMEVRNANGSMNPTALMNYAVQLQIQQNGGSIGSAPKATDVLIAKVTQRSVIENYIAQTATPTNTDEAVFHKILGENRAITIATYQGLGQISGFAEQAWAIATTDIQNRESVEGNKLYKQYFQNKPPMGQGIQVP